MSESGVTLRHHSTLSAGQGSRRRFLRDAGFAAAALVANSASPRIWPQAPSASPPTPNPASPTPDYTIEIAEIEWELAPKKHIRTTAYGGQIPGRVLHLAEGKPVTMEILNKLDRPEIVHWHGQWIPTDVDGSMEEGSPMIPAGGSTLIQFTPRPAGLHWYHTHAMANRDLKRGLYSGQFGVLDVLPRVNPAPWDQEQFIVLHDWNPYYSASGDGSLMVNYVYSSVNGRMLGHDQPIQVSQGRRVLIQIVNASATEVHWLALPGHRFKVLALDGAPVATQASVETLRLGPAERITALVEMNSPGVWVLGEIRKDFRDAGMGTVVEYEGRSGKPQEPDQSKLEWDYRTFGDPSPIVRQPDVTVPLVFTSRFRGHGALDQWMINGRSYPDVEPVLLREGLRHRLVFENHSTDDHPVHLHRHNFELVSIRGVASSGVHKDVVMVEAGTTVEADLVAANPGNTLFHCHQQDHMDAGFMTLFKYA
jgi:FtsP/CotA-like multicopper oxidase with cupredoxin domain